ncbi:MAG: hypothetical protein ABFD50_18860 [Smithella sp.]
MPLYKLTHQQVRQQIFTWIELYYNTELWYTANKENLPPIKKTRWIKPWSLLELLLA